MTQEKKRREKEDRGQDASVEIDLTFDAIERIEVAVADILNIVKDIREKVAPSE